MNKLPLDMKCSLIAECFQADFHFSLDKYGYIRLQVQLSCKPEFGEYHAKSGSDIYSISDLRLLKGYIEDHLTRINNGIYERAKYGFLLLQSEFMIEALKADVREDYLSLASFALHFWVNLAGKTPLSNNFLGFHSVVTLTNARKFVLDLGEIINQLNYKTH